MKNYHTHTVRCRHAFGKDREYIEAAIKAGFTHLGFSDHAPMLFPTDYYSTFRMFPQQIEDYASSINMLRREYKDQIKIYLGFELEYYPALFEKEIEFLKQYNYDYLILGQHFVGNEYDDNSKYSGNVTTDVAVLDGYISQVLQALKTGEFVYVAHPDIIKFEGDEKVYVERMTYFCEEMKKLDYPVEFNMLGFMQKRHYPNDKFWKIVAKTGNDVIIGLDAHSPDVFKNRLIIQQAKEYLNKLGIIPIDSLNIDEK